MKKLFTLFACAVTLFTACTKDDGGTRVRTYEIAVRLIYPDDGSLTAAEGVEVRMTNSSSGTVVQAATDAQGVASFLLPEGIYDRDTFALRLMEKPASFFYSVLWNKLYRRDILADHHLQFTSEVRWAEDLVFNLEYILYANVFVSISKAGYHYVQNPQSICHTQINPATIVQNKLQVFRYYKDLYTRLGIYEEVRPQLYKFLVDIAESTYPSGPFKKAIDEAKAYWKEHQSEK